MKIKSKIWKPKKSALLRLKIGKQDGRFVAMVTKDLQTLKLKFDQVMFNSLVFT